MVARILKQTLTQMHAIAFGAPGETPQSISQASPLPIGGKQESFALANNNVVSAAVTVYGGDYIFAQQAGAYGTVKLQIRAPDGVTWLDLLSKNASDANGAGTGVALPSNAELHVVLTGTAAAFATLKRVP
ncbi:hypothetical protein IWY39_002575 [Sphingobium sp. JAI105]|uniref:hypothetical protein n=1 Tax=Sphingobium sp. JAI105 TaxID=2787715 RepID=UPI0018CAEE02|nr:hypothetical protein [Sphingobium sp. JAI105]MBG6118771.1 hypothetical protein [Sphingobium sp. JAI105]